MTETANHIILGWPLATTSAGKFSSGSAGQATTEPFGTAGIQPIRRPDKASLPTAVTEVNCCITVVMAQPLSK